MTTERVTAPTAAEADQAPVATPVVTGPGVKAAEALLKSGIPDVTKVIEIIDTHRGERDAIFKLLQSSLGNAYVQQTIKAMDTIRLSIKHKELAAGDPSNPESGYFLASAEEKAARWRTADGSFKGTANQKGLDASYQVDSDDALVAKVDAEKKSGTVAWQRDGKTQAELYGQSGEAGVRRTDELSGGATVTESLRHRSTPEGGQAEAALAYNSPNTTASGYVGVREKGGGLVAGADASHTFADKSKLTGAVAVSPDGAKESLTYQTDASRIAATLTENDKGVSGTLSGEHTFTDKTKAAAELSASEKEQALKLSYTTPTSSVTGSVSHDPTKTVATIGGTHQFNKSLTGDASLSHTFGGAQSATNATAGLQYKPNEQFSTDGRLSYSQTGSDPGQTSLSIHERYQNKSVIQTFNLEAGAGARDFAKATGGIDAQLAPKLYGGAWASFSSEGGKQTTSEFGASLTFTPQEQVALTVAGVMNQSGAIEGRLQLDVFKSRINGIADLSSHKKEALFSIYAGIAKNGGAGMLDDRYGIGNHQYNPGGGSGDTQFNVGIKIPF
jgi:hypothetical protein